jgi:hypothetical protein
MGGMDKNECGSQWEMSVALSNRAANKAAAPNRRPALRFGCATFIGSWIRCQSPVPAAVGELVR